MNGEDKWEKFDASVTISSSMTQVDTDEMIVASQKLCVIREGVERCGNSINVLSVAGAATAYAPCASAPSIADALNRTSFQLHALNECIQRLLERIHASALEYAAAEGRADVFNYLRATFYGEIQPRRHLMAIPFLNVVQVNASLLALMGFKYGVSQDRNFMGILADAIKEESLSTRVPSLHLRVKLQKMMSSTFGIYLLYRGTGGEQAGRALRGTADSVSQQVFGGLSIGVDALAQRTQPHVGVHVRRRETAAKISTPILVYSTIDRLTKLNNTRKHGQIEIQHHRSVDAHNKVTNSYSVIVPGTQDWLNNDTSPNDLQTNARALAMLSSDQSEAVEQAMAQQGIKPGDPVEFIGHSQGGIVISQMITHPAFHEKYTVVSAVTAGSPVGNSRVPSHVNMMSLENSKDIVPALAGRPNTNVGNARTVAFDGDIFDDAAKYGKKRNPHDAQVYADAMKRFEGLPHKFGAEIEEWCEQRRKKMEFNDETKTTAYQYDTYQGIVLK